MIPVYVSYILFFNASLCVLLSVFMMFVQQKEIKLFSKRIHKLSKNSTGVPAPEINFDMQNVDSCVKGIRAYSILGGINLLAVLIGMYILHATGNTVEVNCFMCVDFAINLFYSTGFFSGIKDVFHEIKSND